MVDATQRKRDKNLRLVDQVEFLNEEVKTLALNLAILLAKTRAEKQSEELVRMEPDFVRLVNGTVKMVRELTEVLNAAQNQETMVFEVPSGKIRQDRIEFGLRAILEQCSRIMRSLPNKLDSTA